MSGAEQVLSLGIIVLCVGWCRTWLTLERERANARIARAVLRGTIDELRVLEQVGREVESELCECANRLK